uniref:C-type lectin domain-containing protein n=1 Tax=Branchiostoma floridae TaxID=7739 RepID=C3ZFG2_BRAFL|eukprot:XP_002592705.1 hypothetical protein BRAFLDRAFT_67145 [Branchiostoma floridae]
MYKQAEPVRPPFPRPDSGQTSGPPPQPPPVHQGGSHGRVRHGNGASDDVQEGLGESSDTYEQAEEVKRHATYTSADRTYPGGASGRRALCSFIRSHRSYMAAGIVLLLGLLVVGLAPLTFINKERDRDDIRQLSTTVDALKRDQDDMRQLSATVDALKRDQDDIRQLSTTVDALKRDRDAMRQLSATVDALKRDQDDIRQLSATVDALKRDLGDMGQLSTTVDALKHDQDDIRQLSTTVDALKRDRDDMRQLFATVDALKRDQDDIRQLSATVDALKRDLGDMRQLSTTVDALKVDLEIGPSKTTALEQRRHEECKTPASCPKGYQVFSGICYKAFRNTPKSFSDAATTCRQHGGTLAMPRDAETNAFLRSLYKGSYFMAIWFGLHDQRKEGSFEWVDGSALGTYSNWARGQPNNLRNQDCVTYWCYITNNDEWNDEECNKRFSFICQAVPVSPGGGGDVEDETVPGQEEMDRGTTECSVVTVQPPMSQPRPSKSSADVLAELREDGLLPLNTRGESVAFQVPLDKPASEPDAPPRRPVQLEKLEETLQERRERVKKEPAGSRTQLRQQLGEAANRRDEMLAEGSRKLAEKSKRAKTKARAAANNRKGTAFVITSVSDTDAIVPRDSEKVQALEKRLNKRRERVAKRTTADDLEKQQALAAERRKDKRNEIARKSKELGMSSWDRALDF